MPGSGSKQEVRPKGQFTTIQIEQRCAVKILSVQCPIHTEMTILFNLLQTVQIQT